MKLFLSEQTHLLSNEAPRRVNLPKLGRTEL
jgi:hypothetical protein